MSAASYPDSDDQEGSADCGPSARSEPDPAEPPESAEPRFLHQTVMVAEVVHALNPAQGDFFVDATLGGGGHTEAILRASSPAGRVLGLDRDRNALEAARVRLAEFGDRFEAAHARFSDLAEVLRERKLGPVCGILADVGVSSPQIDSSARGFSFSANGPLDMRMDPTQGETAAELIVRLEESELADVLYRFGEERKSRRVARAIKSALQDAPIETTGHLSDIVRRAIGTRRGRIDSATRTFQALRIAVNQELEELEMLLASAPALLRQAGVLCVISFHSLEDRIVKWGFRQDGRLKPLTKKPVTPSEEECVRNRRARSAKLRAALRAPDLIPGTSR
ncbi:MAG: 16S rRNA (cytosine(1402)-N(4))-methyltransferase RsmH [Myxococcota bacterium]